MAWIVPTYKNARPIWRFAERAVAPVAKALDISKSERVIKFPSDGWLGIYTADNPVGILGEAFDLVVLEEAARIGPDVWAETVMPTLADFDGNAILISTPRGRNWFWQEFVGSDGEDQASFTAPTSDNPLPNIQKAFALVKRRMLEGKISERTFNQEWLAKFVEDGAGVFRNVRALSVLKREAAEPEREYMIGVDWGRTNDNTVCSVWDIVRKREVALDKYTGVAFGVQYERVVALAKRYNDALVMAEANGMQDAHVEQLSKRGVRVMPFTTTNASKAYQVERLAGAMERGEVTLQDDEGGILEMESMESSRTPSGLVKYSAPPGMHDDVPMARMIVYGAIGRPRGIDLIGL